VFEDRHLVADNGRAVAVFSSGAERRAALADALSWHVSRRFRADALESDAVLELRAAAALADRIDEFRDVEGLAPVRVDADQVRLLIEAVCAYLAERDVETYQPPEERARLGELAEVVDPLFDLVTELDAADRMLRGASL
jgi:hypothetical protein